MDRVTLEKASVYFARDVARHEGEVVLGLMPHASDDTAHLEGARRLHADPLAQYLAAATDKANMA